MSRHGRTAPVTPRQRALAARFWPVFWRYWGCVALHAVMALAAFLALLWWRLFAIVPMVSVYLFFMMARAARRASDQLESR